MKTHLAITHPSLKPNSSLLPTSKLNLASPQLSYSTIATFQMVRPLALASTIAFLFFFLLTSCSKNSTNSLQSTSNNNPVSFTTMAGAPTAITAMTIYNSNLVVAGSKLQSTSSNTNISNNSSPSQLQQYNGSTWSTLVSASTDSAFTSLCPYNNNLYATGNNFDMLASNQLTTLNDSVLLSGTKLPAQLSHLVALNGFMYAVYSTKALTQNKIQYGVAKFNGTQWSNLGLAITPLSDSASINSLCVCNGVIYAGSNYLYYYNGTSWEAVNGITGTINSLAVYNGSLYIAGTGGSFSTTSNIAIWDGNNLLYLSNPIVTGTINSAQYIISANGYLYCLYAGVGTNTKPQIAISRWNGSTSSPSYLSTSTTYTSICGAAYSNQLIISLKNFNGSYQTVLVN